MTVTLRGTRKHGKYQLHVSTYHQPNWIEKWILFRRAHVVNYVGKGTKWYIMEAGKKSILDFRPVSNRTILRFLKKTHP
jgi:hypothetical protein